jgi:hypothetical protein
LSAGGGRCVSSSSPAQRLDLRRQLQRGERIRSNQYLQPRPQARYVVALFLSSLCSSHCQIHAVKDP